MAPPVLTAEERAEALRKSVAVREERAALRARMKQGKLTLAEVFEDENSPMQGATAWYVLRSIPGIGEVRAGQMLRAAGVAPDLVKTRRIRGLGANQRHALLLAVADMQKLAAA